MLPLKVLRKKKKILASALLLAALGKIVLSLDKRF